MLFIGHGGEAALETVIDLDAPQRLQHRYSHTLMASLLYGPAPANCLLIGLGGGALVHYLSHEFPGMRLDVVEIDPVVAALAREFFEVAAGPRTRIVIADAFDYVQRGGERYDLILVNAHLMPGSGTNAGGLPARLAAEAFFTGLRKRLTAHGAVAFNLVRSADTAAEIQHIRSAFATLEVYHSAAQANVIVVAPAAGTPPGDAALRKRAQALDRRAERGFSFERVLEEREK